MCLCQAQRDAEREKELKLRHTAVQRSLPRPTEVTNTLSPWGFDQAGNVNTTDPLTKPAGQCLQHFSVVINILIRLSINIPKKRKQVCMFFCCAKQRRPIMWHHELVCVDCETNITLNFNDTVQVSGVSFRFVFWLMCWNNTGGGQMWTWVLLCCFSLLPSISAGKRVGPPSHLHGATVRPPAGRGADQTGNDHNAAPWLSAPPVN